MTKTAYPLSWPSGRPRTAPHKRARSAFSRENSHALTLEQARRQLEDELHRLGVRSYILSTNVQLRQDGYPYSGRRDPEDPGVAVYFDLLKRPTVLACDKWDRVPDNIRAIVKHIDALRGQERWGVGSIKQAFAGYQALPAPEQWWQVLGIHEQSDVDLINAAYRRHAKLSHPDNVHGGGSDAAMSRLNAARDAGLRARQST